MIQGKDDQCSSVKNVHILDVDVSSNSLKYQYVNEGLPTSPIEQRNFGEFTWLMAWLSGKANRQGNFLLDDRAVDFHVIDWLKEVGAQLCFFFHHFIDQCRTESARQSISLSMHACSFSRNLPYHFTVYMLWRNRFQILVK